MGKAFKMALNTLDIGHTISGDGTTGYARGRSLRGWVGLDGNGM